MTSSCAQGFLKRVMFCFSLLISVYMVVATSTISAQNEDVGYTIQGRVLDRDTGHPLSGVHVFYQGTSIGDVTQNEGYFKLPVPPIEGIEIVFSMIGYDTHIQSTSGLSADEQMLIRLRPQTIELGDVTVTAELDREWRKNLERFKEIFFNQTDFGLQCTLSNPEILNFTFDRKEDLLSAKAIEPLVVVNSALGYTIEFHKFQLEGNDDFFQWSGFPFFKELEVAESGNREEWLKNRVLAYRGSSKHLFASLADSSLIEEQFRAYRAPLPRGFSFGVPIPEMGPEFREKAKWADSVYVPILYPGLTEDTFIVQTPNTLTVQYLGERESKRYDKSYGSRGSKVQTSWIHFGGASVHIDRFGNRISRGHVSEIGFIGYMGWERIGELLPRDYPEGHLLN